MTVQDKLNRFEMHSLNLNWELQSRTQLIFEHLYFQTISWVGCMSI